MRDDEWPEEFAPPKYIRENPMQGPFGGAPSLWQRFAAWLQSRRARRAARRSA